MATKGTPTNNNLPLRAAEFSTLVEALDYAAQGVTGFNFYNARGQLYCALPYSELRADAVALAQRLLSTGIQPGDRLALIAETGPDFVRFFYACQYAGLVPVPMPAAVHLGGRKAFVNQIRYEDAYRDQITTSTLLLSMNEIDFETACEARFALERACIPLAAARRSPDHLARMRAEIAAQTQNGLSD